MYLKTLLEVAMTNLSHTEITKQNIKEAFWKLYTQGGISKVSVTQICKLAGYNRSTFYTYYQDIYEVLDAIEETVIPTNSFKEDLLIPLMHCQDETALLHQIIVFFESHSPYLPVLLGEYGDPLFRQKLLARLTPLLHDFFLIIPTMTNNLFIFLNTKMQQSYLL